MHTANADTINQFLDDDELRDRSSTSRFGDTGYIMLNVAEGPSIDPEGTNAASPLLNVHCRRALAHAIDRERIAEERGAGLVAAGQRPVPARLDRLPRGHRLPGVRPRRRPVEEMDTCLAELGTDSIEFTFNTTNDPFNVETNTLIISMWNEAFGDQVQATITPIEQGQYIGLALTGDVPGLRLAQPRRPRPRPAAAVVAERVGVADRRAGAQLRPLQGRRDRREPADHQDQPRPGRPQGGRRGDQPALRRAGLQPVADAGRCGASSTQPYVNGVEANILPDGAEGIGLAFAGRHQVNQIWCDDGACE